VQTRKSESLAVKESEIRRQSVMAKEQKGQILVSRGSWALRWREYKPDPMGRVKAKRCFKTLGPVMPFHRHDRVPKEIQAEADKILEPLANDTVETVTGTISELVDKYLQQCAFKPSTLKAYQNIWKRYLLNRIGDETVSGFRRVDAYLLWEQIHKANLHLCRATLAKIKFFLSGVFEWAKDIGAYTYPENPATANLPKNLPGKKETRAYEAEEIKRLLLLLDGSIKGQALLSVAWSSGIRRGELVGLKWEDYDPKPYGAVLHIRRSCWNKKVTTPKTENSADDVFIGPEAVEYLEAYKQSIGNVTEGFMFGLSHDNPIDIRSFAKWTIEPLVNVCAECDKQESAHDAKSNHKYQRNESLPRWLGWNAIRRGAATHLARNFSGDGVKAASLVLRHGGEQVTQNHYIKTSKQERRAHEAAKVANVAQQRQIAASVLGAGIGAKTIH
jgi:integrase